MENNNNIENENNVSVGSKNSVLMTVVGICTLLIALVGATFAYFTATVRDNSTQSISISTVQPAGLIYESTKQLSMGTAKPGDSETGTFTVSNTSNSGTQITQVYDLNLVIDANGFTTAATDAADAVENSAGALALQDQLELRVTGAVTATINLTDGTSNAYKAGASVNLVTAKEIAPAAVHTYNLTLEFKQLNYNQDANRGKTFTAHVAITNVKTKNTNS